MGQLSNDIANGQLTKGYVGFGGQKGAFYGGDNFGGVIPGGFKGGVAPGKGPPSPPPFQLGSPSFGKGPLPPPPPYLPDYKHIAVSGQSGHYATSNGIPYANSNLGKVHLGPLTKIFPVTTAILRGTWRGTSGATDVGTSLVEILLVLILVLSLARDLLLAMAHLSCRQPYLPHMFRVRQMLLCPKLSCRPPSHRRCLHHLVRLHLVPL